MVFLVFVRQKQYYLPNVETEYWKYNDMLYFQYQVDSKKLTFPDKEYQVIECNNVHPKIIEDLEDELNADIPQYQEYKIAKLKYTWNLINILEYRNFLDIPRSFIVKYKNQLFLFDCIYDAQIGYSDHYKVFKLKSYDIPIIWDSLEREYVGEIPLKKVCFYGKTLIIGSILIQFMV